MATLSALAATKLNTTANAAVPPKAPGCRDANRPLKSGEEVFNAQCAACHNAGAAGAPKTGDVAAWAPRLKTGFEALWNSSLKGKNAMGAQGGGAFEDLEIARAVAHLANAGGASFQEPAQPAAAPAQ